MAKKKETNWIPSAIKVAVVMLLAGAIGFGIYTGVVKFFRTCSYFKVKTVRIDPSLQFINSRDLKKMIGVNIFDTNLGIMQRRLSRKYPQVESLKIVKKYPNEIHITAKKREPIAQLIFKKTHLILNEKAMIVSTSSKFDKKFPVIRGLDVGKSPISLGQYIRGKKVLVALNIINDFSENAYLNSYRIKEIGVKNLSKIDVELTNGVHVYFEVDKMEHKINVLGIVLSQGKLKLKEVKYIDMRFKEPILGKK